MILLGESSVKSGMMRTGYQTQCTLVKLKIFYRNAMEHTEHHTGLLKGNAMKMMEKTMISQSMLWQSILFTET